MSGCFENGCRNVSGAIAYDSLLVIRSKSGCGLRKLVKGVDRLRGMETDGAEGSQSLAVRAHALGDLRSLYRWSMIWSTSSGRM